MQANLPSGEIVDEQSWVNSDPPFVSSTNTTINKRPLVVCKLESLLKKNINYHWYFFVRLTNLTSFTGHYCSWSKIILSEQRKYFINRRVFQQMHLYERTFSCYKLMSNGPFVENFSQQPQTGLRLIDKRNQLNLSQRWFFASLVECGYM